MFYGMGMNMDPSVELGRYRIEGNLLIMTSNQQETSNYDFELTGRFLRRGKTRYTPCN